MPKKSQRYTDVAPGSKPGRSPRRLWSLLTLLLAFVIALVIPTAAMIGLTTYVNTRREVTRLANINMGDAAQQARQRTVDYLSRAEPMLKLTLDLLASDPACGVLRPRPPGETGWRARARLLLRVKQAHPEVTMLHYGDQFGDFTMADRYSGMDIHPPPGSAESLWLHHRWIRRGRPYGRVYEARDADRWGAAIIRNYRFDARKRLWYRKASERGGLFWSPPYRFIASQRPGITAAMPLLRHGRTVGVLGISLDLRDLSAFVKQLSREPGSKVFLLTDHRVEEHSDSSQNLVPTGKVFAVTEEGVILPDGTLVPAETGSASRLASPPALPRSAGGVLVDSALRLYQDTRHSVSSDQPTVREFRSASARHLSVYQWFNTVNLRWMVVVAVPEANILGPARRNSLYTLAWCTAALLASLLVGAALAARVLHPLRAFAREMGRVERLEISPHASPPSRIEEVQVMGQALDRMKLSLLSFQKYVPADLVRALLQSGQEARLGGQTATITLFFADVANFTPLSERLSPPELVDSLAGYLEEIDSIISHHGGIVDKYIGDAVMALWGAPIHPQCDPEKEACAAALEYQERLELLRRRSEAEGRTFFEGRIGIHTGEALVGNIGSQRRMNYTAMGDTVNVTKRLEELNRLYGTRILISEATYHAVHEAFETRLIDCVMVRGKSRAFPVYELLAHRGMLDEALRPLLDTYTEGLRLYRDRQWQAASEQFQRSLELAPQPDPPSRLFLTRCQTYLQSPPPPDWDGTYVVSPR